MSKDVTILGLGLLTALLPFLGFPNTIERIFFLFIGLGIVILAVLIRGDLVENSERNTESFVENKRDTTEENFISTQHRSGDGIMPKDIDGHEGKKE